MKLEFKLVENCSIINNSYDVNLKGEFINITNENIISPSIIHKQSSVYSHEINDVHIYGGRCLIKDNLLYLDTPLEWSYNNNIDYIKRVRKVHKNEFNFISDDFEFQEKRPLLKLNKDIFHCGSVEHWNFGFFLTVLMPKIFYCNLINPNKSVLIPIKKNWQVQLLREFFPHVDFIFYDPDIPVYCENVTSMSWPEFGFYINQDYLEFIRKRTIKYQGKNTTNANKIFLSREKNIRIDDRICLDKSRSMLSKKGYDIIIPEQFSYQHLFHILHSSSSIIVESGSALFNALFADVPNVTVLESRSAFIGNHYRFGASTSNNFKMIFFDKITEDKVIDYII